MRKRKERFGDITKGSEETSTTVEKAVPVSSELSEKLAKRAKRFATTNA
jgi:hypothetical protein